MDNEKIGQFVFELRKSKQMTQKDLAAKLNITDKAVSKWERGLGYPDITTFSSLAKVLGVTTNELLSGKREVTQKPKAEMIIQNTWEYAEKVSVSKNRKICSLLKFIITVSFLLSIIVCIICDLAISQSLTWSLYTISSVVFAWLIIMPLVHFQKNAVAISLVSLSFFIIPFLYALQRIIGSANWMLPLGIPIAVSSIIYLWSIWVLFAKTKLNRWYSLGITLTLAIPLTVVINIIVSRFTNEPYFEVGDAMSLSLLSVVAIIAFTLGRYRRKKTSY